jgi:hypothetical protein
MDDDLNALRGGSPSSDDDFFSSFESSSAETMTGGTPAGGSGSLDVFDQPSPPAAPAKRAKAPAKKKAKKRSGEFLGMSPQQRMILSIFLFLDVAVLGVLILIAAGSIGI